LDLEMKMGSVSISSLLSNVCCCIIVVKQRIFLNLSITDSVYY